MREGKYEFKNPNVGVYDGEWSNCFLHGKGTLVVGKVVRFCPSSFLPVFIDAWQIYDGYWDEKYRAGFGYVDGKYKGTVTCCWML